MYLNIIKFIFVMGGTIIGSSGFISSELNDNDYIFIVNYKICNECFLFFGVIKILFAAF